MKKPLPQAPEDLPVKLTRAVDKHRARFEDALVSLSDLQEELKQARLELKDAQKAYIKARRAGPAEYDSPRIPGLGTDQD